MRRVSRPRFPASPKLLLTNPGDAAYHSRTVAQIAAHKTVAIDTQVANGFPYLHIFRSEWVLVRGSEDTLALPCLLGGRRFMGFTCRIGSPDSDIGKQLCDLLRANGRRRRMALRSEARRLEETYCE